MRSDVPAPDPVPGATARGERPDHPVRATESFYGRRKGPPLGPRKARLVAEALPRLALDLGAAAPADPRALFARPVDTLVMEIGFGGGEHLAAQAAAHPSTGFVGIEPFVNGMAKLLARIEDAGLDNVRLHDDDASALLDWWPPGTLDRIDLLYPDPWPKKRHWKRRFVGPANLSRIATALKPGGTFRFASDIDTYVDWTLRHVSRHARLEWTAARADDWRRPWEGWVRTRYEAKAIREGRTPAYLVFAKPLG